jgi:hypothetical protein
VVRRVLALDQEVPVKVGREDGVVARAVDEEAGQVDVLGEGPVAVVVAAAPAEDGLEERVAVARARARAGGAALVEDGGPVVSSPRRPRVVDLVDGCGTAGKEDKPWLRMIRESCVLQHSFNTEASINSSLQHN